MKNLILATLIMLNFGCATAFVDQEGVAAFTLARNIEVSDCNDCENGSEEMPKVKISTSKEQTSTLNSVFGGLFGAIKAVAVGILPRGVAIPSDS